MLKGLLGGVFIDTFVTLKTDEIERYKEAVDDPSTREVTAWETQEYLRHY